MEDNLVYPYSDDVVKILPALILRDMGELKAGTLRVVETLKNGRFAIRDKSGNRVTSNAIEGLDFVRD